MVKNEKRQKFKLTCGHPPWCSVSKKYLKSPKKTKKTGKKCWNGPKRPKNRKNGRFSKWTQWFFLKINEMTDIYIWVMIIWRELVSSGTLGLNLVLEQCVLLVLNQHCWQSWSRFSGRHKIQWWLRSIKSGRDWCCYTPLVAAPGPYLPPRAVVCCLVMWTIHSSACSDLSF